jgi:hypothetical protein
MTTDEPDLPRLSPEDDEHVRRLLADARESGPMPPEVAARLEDTIVGLAAARATGATDTPQPAPAPVPASETVIPIRRSRRHRVVAVLGAAAAVAVVGLGVGTFFERDEPAQDASSADSPVDRGAGGVADRTDTDAAPEDAEQAEAARPSGETLVTDQPAKRVRSRHLARDLVSVQLAVLPHPATANYDRTNLTAPADFACASADWGRGVLVAVRYDGHPAVVAFRKPVGRSQVAEVLQCGTAEVLRSTTLAAE